MPVGSERAALTLPSICTHPQCGMSVDISSRDKRIRIVEDFAGAGV
jgi:hypothetical protein